ncbi:glycosyl hydrolase family 2 [Cohnella sp. SGD-V74]|uniref:glycoside hydrolase family 2 protein n=1 Tax=unclassified Cohnella TaxID=2636738 RepID=UPI000D4D78D5|nr:MULTISPECIES: sugar-binding domain-containing protein [unclassified Cohnella]PRX71932.1 glycosyl hydrolase family 2 [Cohnella sp. SGD-V74]
MSRRETVLDGEWEFLLDPEDRYKDAPPNAAAFGGGSINVPGSWEEQGYGEEPAFPQIDTWTKLREYVGAGWYRKTVRLERTDEGAQQMLELAGVRWTTEVWVNGVFAGLRDSLSAVHRYELGDALTEGDNELLVRVDNRMRLPLADSHIHTRHTATEWGGITGGVKLVELPAVRLGRVSLVPDPLAGTFRCRVEVLTEEEERAGCEVQVRFRAPSGEVFSALAPVAEGGVAELVCELGDAPALWSDRNPQLYEAEFLLKRGEETMDCVARRTGLRRLAASGKGLELNGKPVWLRGYVDCCVFPLTGYPVWDKAHYERQFRIARSYGFNHVRLHGWNAPEPFWEAADEAGMLVQTELPHWSAHYQPRGAKPPEEVDAFLQAELERIYESLNAHPSFVLFSMGNELTEDNGHERLNEWVRYARRLDPTRLVTDNTGFGQLPEQDREGDFFIPSFNWHVPLKTEEIALPATNRDFSAVARLTDKPVLGHEHAQFTMYARPEEKEKYTGVLRPTWLETIEETLRAKGLEERVDGWIEATGVHQVRALKEAMERARRTPGAAGVQLLDIRDFPGQGHATTGLLDVFWGSKGTIEPERALDFNGPTVLLMACEGRTLFAGETMDVRILLSHYGEEPELAGCVGWRLFRKGSVLDEGERGMAAPVGGAADSDRGDAAGRAPSGAAFAGTAVGKSEWSAPEPLLLNAGELVVVGTARGSVEEIGTVRIGLPAGAEASELVLEVWWGDKERLDEDREIRNAWSFWSFPRMRYENAESVWSSVPALKTALYGASFEPNAKFDPFVYPSHKGVKLAIVERLTTNALQYLNGGGRVWLLAGESELYDAPMTKYLPVFWNYLMFSEQAGGTMGAVVRPHPALGRFPHDGRSDWHWYHLFNGTPAICLDTVPEVKPIVEIVDNFNRAKRLASVFEAQVGQGKLFVTTLAFRSPPDWKRPESAHLFGEMLRYLLGDDFRPSARMTVGQVLGLFRLRGIHSFL